MKINDIKAIDAVKKCNIPVIFIHARDDDIVKFQHSLDLFNNYGGNEKELKEVTGGHNGRRNPSILESVGRFFTRHLINENDINNNFTAAYNENNNEINEDSSKNENSHENYNFDLSQRKRKTIYEEWGMGDNKLNKGVNNRKEYNSFSFKVTNKNDNLRKEEKKTEDKNLEDKKEDKKIEDKNLEDKKEDNKNKIKNENNKSIDSKKIKTKIILNNNFIKDINSISKEKINSKIDMITNSNSNTNTNYNDKILSNKDNNIDSSLDQPKIKRKTIYDDLNIRP